MNLSSLAGDGEKDIKHLVLGSCFSCLWLWAFNKFFPMFNSALIQISFPHYKQKGRNK